MKKYIILLIASFLIIIVFIIGLDLLNITSYIPLSSKYDWLSFLGSILGGIIGGIVTFSGIFITLKNQKRADNERDRLTNIPIFEYKISYDKHDFDNSKGQLSGEIISHINLEGSSYDNPECEEWYFKIEISNIGIGHGQIKEIQFIFGDNNYSEIQEERIGFVYKLVKTNNKKSFYFLIYAPKERFASNHISGEEFIYTIKIIFKYQDLLGNNYDQLLYASITNSVLLDNGEIVNRWNTADLHYYENFRYIDNKNLY